MLFPKQNCHYQLAKWAANQLGLLCRTRNLQQNWRQQFRDGCSDCCGGL